MATPAAPRPGRPLTRTRRLRASIAFLLAAMAGGLRALTRARRHRASIALLLAAMTGGLLLLPLRAPPARACGGPEFYDLDGPLNPTSALIEQISVEGDFDTLMPRDAFRFLYPWRTEDSAKLEPLWNFAYGFGDFQPAQAPVTTAMDAAIKAGDLKTAEAEARKLVDQVLDMPAAGADPFQKELARAVELIELLPSLNGVKAATLQAFFLGTPAAPDPDSLSPALKQALEVRGIDRTKAEPLVRAKPDHPRAGTLRFVALQESIKTGIPNGWVDEIRSKTPASTWQSLEKSIDGWLAATPQHPLADLVRLERARVGWLKGDAKAAWDAVLMVYPRHLPRVLQEMRYLIKKQTIGVGLETPGLDPRLLSALALEVTVKPADWTRLWKVSEENAGKPWAVNLQERLLLIAAREAAPGRLPEGFPAEAKKPSPMWGKLRALALMKAGKLEEAGKQLFSLDPDPEQSLLAAHYHLRRNDPATAALVIGLPVETRHYLIRVLADDAGLKKLETAKNKEIRDDARLSAAVRLAGAGEWAKGLERLGDLSPERAALWKQAATLSADRSPAGMLRWARYLREQNGKLFFGEDRVWYRSLNYRLGTWSMPEEAGASKTPAPDATLPGWKPTQEREAITRHLTGSTELWLALQAYVAWLEKAAPGKEMRDVLKEADTIYNRLVNWDSTNSSFWADYLAKHEVVAKLRAQGKRAKGG